MPLQPGTRVGPYEVVSSVAAGGMGEVYRALDPRLGREVAIKVITAALSQNPDAVARFEREARSAASLNHPNILGVFDVGTVDGTPYIVTELLEGSTLRERLLGGGLPVRRVLEWGTRIADALAAVHSKGVVHRDLKPGNIFVTADQRVKVLDFGLAKLVADDTAEDTKTFEAGHTATGVVVGTTAYMSPEQVSGTPLDHRSDIFSLGVVVYEMLTGQRPFQRDSQLATMSAIANAEVPPPSSVLPGIPPLVDQIVQRCLEKRPEARFQSASDLAFALTAATASSSDTTTLATQGRRSRRRRIAAVVATAAVSMAAGAGGAWWMRQSEPAQAARPKHFVIDLTRTPLSEDLLPLAISPDGGTIAFSTGLYEGRQLAIRRLAGTGVTVLPGTLGGREPFFSPDGQWIAFRGGRELRKVPVGGGPVVDLVSAGQAMGVASSMGGTWSSDGHIYYSYAARLWRVSENGGTPELIATPDGTRNEGLYEWPQVLPGNAALLLTVVTPTPAESSRVGVMPIGGGAVRSLVEGAAFGRYFSTGHLFYVQGSTGFVVTFDPRAQKITGPAVAVIENIRTGAAASAVIAASDDGTMVYAEGTSQLERRLAWVDRTGRTTPIDHLARRMYYPRISADGTRVAISILERGVFDIWLDDLREPAPTRLTLDGVTDSPPLWTRDARAIVATRRLTDGTFELVRYPVETGKAPVVLQRQSEAMWPGSFSPDGQQLTFMRNRYSTTEGDIDVMRPAAGNESTPVVNSPATEWGGLLSPDGRWLAYVSNRAGRWDVYVVPFPGPGSPRLISADGGSEIVWRRDGRELFYRNGSKLYGVPITRGPSLGIGSPRILFDAFFILGQPGLANYDVSPDGERFLMVQADPRELSAPPLHVIVNGFDGGGRVNIPAR